MNFNAEELSNTIKTIEDLIGWTDRSVPTNLDHISWGLKAISEAVFSEDSGLASTCGGLANTFTSIEVKLQNLDESIIKEITNYEKETLSNESGATQSLDEINGNLETINSTLASI